jgi:predicted ATP-dependent protease
LADPTFEFAKPLPAELLYRRTDPKDLPFDLCSELPDAPVEIGQERAAEAVRFAMRMRAKGYNVYALGDAGTGRHELVAKLLHDQAGTEKAPSDWCYVNNFDDPQKPRCLSLPPGRGTGFAAAMKGVVEELRASLPTAFERDEFRARREVIDQQFKQRNEEAFGAVQQRAEAQNIVLLRTPTGLAMAPKQDGKVMEPEVFEALPEDQRKAIEHEIESIQGELATVMRQVPQWEREHRDAARELIRDTTGFVVGHLIEEVRARYADHSGVPEYLDAVERNIKENAEDFLPQQQHQASAPQPDGAQPPPGMAAAIEDARFRRYQVNVIVDNGGATGAPVVFEDNPNHQTLVGRAEHLARFGALVTDFNLLAPGALHRANGGYLVIEATKLLTGNYGWPSLKRALTAGEIRIESLEQMFSVATTVSLEPQPIPLKVKVVLLGPPQLYYLLSGQDEEFPELFKIAADFNDRVERSAEMTLLYARMIAGLVRREKLRCFDHGAVALIIERTARLAADADRLTTQKRAIIDLLHEADQLAADAGKEIVGAAEVQAAIEAQFRRGDRIYRRLQEEIARGTIRVETSGTEVGQVNGLAVMSLGSVGFGNPSRITAQVRLGRGEVIDIEREVALGGPLHSKGVLILSGFLGGRFGASRPLSLHASLVFEQNYGGVDGDSASGAELFALLSALAEAPIKQRFAVTGSVDQHGRIQAIGGANEKIEGFFDVCRLTGFSGEQGVIIPASNVKHLMLRHDVVEAAAAGKFAIYPIDTVDQGLELLTGIPAGEAGPDGNYPPGTLNHRIAARLDAFAEASAALMRQALAAATQPGPGS